MDDAKNEGGWGRTGRMKQKATRFVAWRNGEN